MHKKTIIFSLLFIFAIGISLNFIVLNNSNQNDPIENENTIITLASNKIEEEFKWFSMEDALTEQAKTGKKIFVDVYTTWCGPCKWLEANTFSNAVIREILTEYYIPTKFNAEGKDSVYFKGKLFVNPKPDAGPRKSVHELTYAIAQTAQGISYPTMVFIDEKLNVIQPVSGALSAEQLEPILAFFGTNAYIDIKWDEYLKTFQTKLTQTKN